MRHTISNQWQPISYRLATMHSLQTDDDGQTTTVP